MSFCDDPAQVNRCPGSGICIVLTEVSGVNFLAYVDRSSKSGPESVRRGGFKLLGQPLEGGFELGLVLVWVIVDEIDDLPVALRGSLFVTACLVRLLPNPS
jgi:hypothetical protein